MVNLRSIGGIHIFSPERGLKVSTPKTPLIRTRTKVMASNKIGEDQRCQSKGYTAALPYVPRRKKPRDYCFRFRMFQLLSHILIAVFKSEQVINESSSLSHHARYLSRS